MKKLISLLLVLILTLPALALADLPDISGLTDEELLQLDWKIQAILYDHQLEEGVLVPAGDYVVGADIPAGDYKADAVSKVGGLVNVYKTVDDYEKGGFHYALEVTLGDMWGTYSFHLKLEEGNVLHIYANSLKLYRYHGLMDFQEGDQK
jgi:hypothetical protein